MADPPRLVMSAQDTAPGGTDPGSTTPGPNQRFKDQLDALIDAQLLPDPPPPPASRRTPRPLRAAGVADRVRRAIAPDAAAGRTP